MPIQQNPEEILEMAKRAFDAYQRSETKAEVEDIMVRYGKNGIGYRKLCRILFSKVPIERALKGPAATE